MRTRSLGAWLPFAVLLATLLQACALHATATVSFSLSTSKTFSPGEKPSIRLYSRNVDALEFRIYRVNDAPKFLSHLKDLHSFQNGSPWASPEQIDERTWLERFHDWKHDLWVQVRNFFRLQVSRDTAHALRAKQSTLARRSPIVGVAQFAQIPLLNDKQLIARWRQLMPPTYVSDAQDLPIDPLPAGLYLVEATDGHYKAYTLILVSDMALITRTTSGTVLAYCVNRHTGEPIAGVSISSGLGLNPMATATTDVDGLATLHGPVSKQDQENLWVVASTGKDTAIVTPASYAFTASGAGEWASYVYTDRPVYRPGHVVHWKAILRRRVDNHLELPKPQAIHVAINDEQDHPVFDQQMQINAEGDVSGDLTLPASASLGYYNLSLGDGDDAAHGEFRVEDYRKPEYQVRVAPAKPRVLQGESMQVTIDSRFFFGEPVANAKVKYRVFHSPHFWWDEGDDDSDGTTGASDADGNNGSDADGGLYDADQQSEQTGTLDANGKLTITVQTQVDNRPHRQLDQDYTVEAAVTDESNREITGRGHFLATYGSFRIHVEPVSYAIKVGDPALFNVTAVDYDNKPVQTTVHLKLVSYRWRNGKTDSPPGPSTDVTTDVNGKAQATLPIPSGGGFEVKASATTLESRVVTDSSYIWVMGPGEQDWSGGESRQLQVVTDKKSYAVGDTAHISILSQIEGFHALVVATGYSAEFTKVLASDGKTLTFDLPITTDAEPNLDLSVVFLKDDQMYEASKNISVPPVQQQLQIEITPAKTVFQPQQPATYDVNIHDFAGKPVSADLSFGVVDEAIYSIHPDSSGDIVGRLYPRRYVNASVDSSLQFYFSGEAGLQSPMLAERKARFRPQLAQVKPGNDVVQPKIRKAFPDTAFWAASVHTDSQGHAKVSLTYPDSLTTWRATVRAVTADSKAGSAVNRIIVRKNIIVRMGTPRFMLKGDEITLPVIVHNYLDEAKQVQLTLDVSGLDKVAGQISAQAQQVMVPSKGDGVVSWRLHASQIGTARLLAKALTNEESDALEITFPVEPVGVPRTIDANGALAAPEQQAQTPINFPPGNDPAAHSLHVEVSPSIAGSLFAALDTLTSYPYGCTEQTMSSFLPDVVVAESLKKLNLTAHIDQADLNAKVEAGLDRLASFEHEDGGWGWWKEDDSRVFMTAYVVAGMTEAEHAGYPKARAYSRGVDYLQTQLEQHPRMIPDLRAYVVYALSGTANPDTGKIKSQLDTLYSRRGDLSAEGLALTGLVMLKMSDSRSASIATLVESKTDHTGGLASWPSGYSPLLDFYYDNNAESTAFALRFLVHADPQSPLLAQAAQWLVMNRHGEWWFSTEQTAMVIFGLVDYLAASQELSADFDAEVMLNGSSIGRRHFSPADAVSGATLSVDVPAEKLQPQGNSVQIVKHGSGRAYWTAQGKLYSTEQRLYQNGSLSLNLTRDYYKLVPFTKDGAIVYRLDPLRGPVQIGDTLAVHIAVNGSENKYLLIEDPIPAGTEFVEHEDSYNIDHRPDAWEYWYTRREFHDDRAAIFAAEFSGHHESFYLLKVVNPGSFAISPAHVEPMYQPGIQASSDAQHLDVDAPAPQGGARLTPVK